MPTLLFHLLQKTLLFLKMEIRYDNQTIMKLNKKPYRKKIKFALATLYY